MMPHPPSILIIFICILLDFFRLNLLSFAFPPCYLILTFRGHKGSSLTIGYTSLFITVSCHNRMNKNPRATKEAVDVLVESVAVLQVFLHQVESRTQTDLEKM
ncbi:hypothetical protein P168DRAFT_138445 [Aspergillus campestris IBT 28561]|uniref:Uncharacterized protein n=1 Tax=Aspergillus campestris (strain IBT 28561) TaxID=1392248 RepID=A0A2I1D4E8_ASPC2|nr:uncharacterized protein P168DRAFT_138445 [Aspergillus campestris IBT 28561]PKY04757.1 hypothetical protein P168DRAFT_138445 [Aspergillus campestris IBT 28561]